MRIRTSYSDKYCIANTVDKTLRRRSQRCSDRNCITANSDKVRLARSNHRAYGPIAFTRFLADQHATTPACHCIAAVPAHHAIGPIAPVVAPRRSRYLIQAKAIALAGTVIAETG